jgi:AraC-like DNA-binding protein
VALYKMPPGKWLLNRRLDHAEVLLRRSVRLVAEIAAESGFENPTHFNRVFKERFGVTPLQYRVGRKIDPER